MLSNNKIKCSENSDPSEKQVENHAAVTLQKHFRGFITRKKYGIHQLPTKKLTRHPTFVVGNDPAMPSGLERFQEQHDKIALLATSGIRTVSLACKLGNSKNIPKIILIDNSKLVYEFWHALREFTKDPDKAGTSELFFQHLPSFLNDHKHLYRQAADNELTVKNSPQVKYLNQNIKIHLNTLFTAFGYDYVRAVILHTTLIKQTWADSETFVKLKNILNYHNIKVTYIYVSNIVASIPDTQVQDQILENIKNMMPFLSIHTNYCQMHGLPEKVSVFRNQNPTGIKNTIFAYKYTEECYKDTPLVQVVKNK
jgi:hypothetical protein